MATAQASRTLPRRLIALTECFRIFDLHFGINGFSAERRRKREPSVRHQERRAILLLAVALPWPLLHRDRGRVRAAEREKEQGTGTEREKEKAQDSGRAAA